MSEHRKRFYRPGERAPAGGIYECDCGQGHRFSTDLAGHPFPPVPAGCSGATWTLKIPVHPA